jgi:hypothetical protein
MKIKKVNNKARVANAPARATGKAKDIYFDGTMIMTKDRSSQKVNLTLFKPNP